MAPRMRYPVPDLAEWSRPNYQIAWQRAEDDFGWDRGLRPTTFEVDYVRFEPRTEDDVSWVYQRKLGTGGFGLVGLWEKRNEIGDTVDNLAVKEMPMPRTNVYPPRPNGKPIPEEAIIQTALQKKNCVPVLQIRGMNIITAPAGFEEKLRLYLEFCPHGDLHRILVAYHDKHIANASNSLAPTTTSESIPEPFLWQLLYSFAQVIAAMEQTPFDHPNAHDMGQNPYILHLDVKTLNIMLGEPDDEEIIKGYPSCKVGDWGLARLTSLTDPRNSASFRSLGTPGWRPPEQANNGEFCWSWTHLAPWRNAAKRNTHVYTPGHSVFAFASVIFRLMTLDVDGSKLNGLCGVAHDNERAVRACGFKYIGVDEMSKNVFGRPTGYSFRLRDAIADCLNLNPAFRPKAADLERLARAECTWIASEQFKNGHNTFADLQIPERASTSGAITW